MTITLFLGYPVVVCGPLEDPVNGRVIVTSEEFGGEATYRCDSGFILVGNTQRSCATTGWTGQDPTCRCKYCSG